MAKGVQESGKRGLWWMPCGYREEVRRAPLVIDGRYESVRIHESGYEVGEEGKSMDMS